MLKSFRGRRGLMDSMHQASSFVDPPHPFVGEPVNHRAAHDVVGFIWPQGRKPGESSTRPQLILLRIPQTLLSGHEPR